VTSPVRIAVVGAGMMGASHARVARALRSIELVGIVDVDLKRAQACAGSGERAVQSIAEIVGDIDAAVIAVPTLHHSALALQLMKAGRSVLIEKPISYSIAESEELILTADKEGVVLAVGHVERFNAAVAELPKLIDCPIHIRTQRISPYSPRINDGVIMDLMIHDIDIVLSIARPDAEVESVSAVGVKHHSDTEDLATATIAFKDGLTATLTTSRLGQQKIRSVEITQLDGVITADLVNQNVTIHKMSHNEYVSDDGLRYRQSGIVEIPFLDTVGEPLARQLEDFAHCVRSGSEPRVGGQDAADALKLAQRIASTMFTAKRVEIVR
jgi:UDP-N-acetylglucosamine 3-dehydrogenase